MDIWRWIGVMFLVGVMLFAGLLYLAQVEICRRIREDQGLREEDIEKHNGT